MLANFNNTVVWIVLILSLISSFPSLFSSLLETVLSAPTIIGITVTFMFHSFSTLWQDSSISLSFHFLFAHGLLKQQNPLSDEFFCSS